MLTYEEQERMRQEAVNEVGTEPPCPFCRKLRVARSDYVRCNGCGVNWLNEEMHLPNYLDSDPRVARRKAVLTATGTKPIADTSEAGAEIR